MNIKGNKYKWAVYSGQKSDWDSFRLTKLRVNTLIRYKKRRFIVSTLNNNKRNPKCFWKEMGDNLHIGKHKPSVGCNAIRIENGLIVTYKLAADAMNDYYVNVGPKLAKKFKADWSASRFFNILNVVPFSFNFVTVDNIQL